MNRFDVTQNTTVGPWPIPQQFPGPTPTPFIPPYVPYAPYVPPRGHWEWVPDYGCPACRGHVCMCVRTPPVWPTLQAGETVTFTSTGAAIVALS